MKIEIHSTQWKSFTTDGILMQNEAVELAL